MNTLIKSYLSDEMLFLRQGLGLKMVAPNFRCHDVSRANATLKSLFEMPASVYIYSDDQRFAKSNEANCHACGFDAPNQLVSKSLFDFLPKQSAQPLATNNANVLTTKRFKIFEESLIRNDQANFHSLTIKMPLLSTNNNIIGILGISIVHEIHSFCDSLEKLIEANWITKDNYQQNHFIINETHLTKRETNISVLLVRGKTAREIAILLNLSRRTVEHYIENLKIKLGAKRKSDLIEILINNTLNFK